MPAPVVYKGTLAAAHKDLTGEHLHPPGAHTHPESDVTNLITDLATINALFATKQPLDATLTSLSSYNTNGLLTQTAADTFVGRAITGTASQVDVANGSGVGGNPTVSLNTGVTDYLGYTVTYGPFYINDLPGTATTIAQLGFFNTATALSLSTNEIRASRLGEVVGISMVSDASRTAGTATARVRLAGTGTTFASGGCQLAAGTDNEQWAAFVARGSGVAIASSGNLLGIDVVTSGWTPITANLALFLIVQYNPF